MNRSKLLLLVLPLVALLAACPPAPEPEGAVAAEQVAQLYPEPEGAWEVERPEFERRMEQARAVDLVQQPVGERMVGFGRTFLGLPYVAHTLEMPGPEQLVVNLKELDCVTLVENALAFSHTATGEATFGQFLHLLEEVRYRGGRLEGYTSRLHYFSDWIRDNEQKGFVRDITRELGGEPYPKRIDFMTRNSDAYAALREHPELVDSMRLVEQELNRAELYWIPQERIAEVESRIREGDIIGITTRIEGLDISHTGIATWVDGRLHMLHAPDVGQPVEITARPLAERITAQRQQHGIMVARPLER